MNSKFWIVSLGLLLMFGQSLRAAADHRNILSIYGDYLDSRFDDRSTTLHDLACTTTVHTGSNSIAAQFTNYNSLNLHSSLISVGPFFVLSFWINGGSQGGQQFSVQAFTGQGIAHPAVDVRRYIRNGAVPAKTWVQVVIPLSDLGVSAAPDFSGLSLNDISGRAQSPLYLDDMMLVSLPVAD